jgi:hypothetical protein
MDWCVGGREFARGVSDWQRRGTGKIYRREAEVAEKGGRDPSADVNQRRRPQDDDACCIVRNANWEIGVPRAAKLFLGFVVLRLG